MISKKLIYIALALLITGAAIAWHSWYRVNTVEIAAATPSRPSPVENANKFVVTNEPSAIKSLLPEKGKYPQLVQTNFTVTATTPDKIIAEVRGAAQSGVPAAQRALADALYHCATANMGSDEDIEKQIIKRQLAYEAAAKNAQRPVADDPADPAYRAHTAVEVERAKALRESCKNVSAQEIKAWLPWLEKAAVSGDSQARFGYAWTALDEFATKEDQLANNDEYARRRDLAFRLLQDSVANGDCNDMLLNGFRKVTPDPISSYVYQSLLLRRGLAMLSNQISQQADQERASINSEIKRLAAGVPEDQLGSATEAIGYIQNTYCGGQ